jgi:PIN domain nuclease of toxin-antitoxin system
MTTEPARLAEGVRTLLRSADTTALLSAAVAWELAIKWRLGKLELPAPPRELVPSMTTVFALTPLPINQLHTVAVAELPEHHRDPFDRLLVAQAQVEGVPLVTADRRLSRYDIEVIAAA